MSVILYDDEKFRKIAESLKLQSREHVYFFYGNKYNEATGNGLKEKIEEFVQELANMNTAASNSRYGETRETREIDFYCVLPYVGKLALIKSLQGLRYNCHEAENEKLMDRLTDLIYDIMSDYIGHLPAYESIKGAW